MNEHATGRVLWPLAPGAMLVDYPDLPESQANALAAACARHLERAAPAGFLDAVVGARTLYLEFDPDVIRGSSLAELLVETAPDLPENRRCFEIPVQYGGPQGIDLADLARDAGLTGEEFARRHAAASYRVGFLGFAPGFAYLIGLPPELRAPRLSTPRTRVPSGAVAIGGPYTGIYPGGTPGGWRILGTSSVRLFDPSRDPAPLLLPGDHVRFVAVSSTGAADRKPASEAGNSAIAGVAGVPILRVLEPGVFSSVQGPPRYGWSQFGVPVGGAMDAGALEAGNALLGNAPEDSGLEMTLVGAELETLEDATICLAGAVVDARLNEEPLSAGVPVRLRPGQRLRVGRIHGGARTYLCVEGGFAQSSRPLISPRLSRGDLLLRNPAASLSSSSRLAQRRKSSSSRIPPGGGCAISDLAAETVVRVVLDPRGEVFTQAGIATLIGSVYRLSAASDRRGLRLEGPPIELAAAPDIAPEGTPLGAIQVARDGLPIVLGPDRPVTGGFARIATVLREDFARLAQVVAGRQVRFELAERTTGLPARVG